MPDAAVAATPVAFCSTAEEITAAVVAAQSQRNVAVLGSSVVVAAVAIVPIPSAAAAVVGKILGAAHAEAGEPDVGCTAEVERGDEDGEDACAVGGAILVATLPAGSGLAFREETRENHGVEEGTCEAAMDADDERGDSGAARTGAGVSSAAAVGGTGPAAGP